MQKFLLLLVMGIISNLVSAAESKPTATLANSHLYICRCIKTTDKSPPSGQTCNFPGFSIALSEERAVISGYFSGKPKSSKKGKSEKVTYVGFDGFDFHYQISLEVEPEKNLAIRQMKLHATGEKDLVEVLKCTANQDKIRH